jgi:biopolymer transport protein ExbD
VSDPTKEDRMPHSFASASPRSEINVTPLVDVVLVLLIIFMVITPALDEGFQVALPASAIGPTPARHLVTVTLGADGSLTLNGASILRRDLDRRLSELFAIGADRQVLFDGADSVSDGDAMDAMDGIRRAGGRVSIAMADTPPARTEPGVRSGRSNQD